MNKICCVEDDSAILTALQYTLSQEGYEVMTAMTKTQGLCSCTFATSFGVSRS